VSPRNARAAARVLCSDRFGLLVGGRQSVLNVHMAMRDKSDRNAAEHRKACIEAEVR
jgi:hypothetical protein